jgi:hypothetical protein
MNFIGTSLAVLLGVSTLLGACGSDSDKKNKSPFSGPSCQAGPPTGSGQNAACTSCSNSKCPSQCINSACADFFNCYCACPLNDANCYQGCFPKQTQACTECTTSISSCVQQSCASECGLGAGGTGGRGGAGGTGGTGGRGGVGGTGGPGGASGLGGTGSANSCNQLRSCCPQLPASQAECTQIADMGDADSCQLLLDAVQSLCQ